MLHAKIIHQHLTHPITTIRRLGIEEPTWDEFYGPATVEEAKPFDEFFSHATDMEMDMYQVGVCYNTCNHTHCNTVIVRGMCTVTPQTWRCTCTRWEHVITYVTTHAV
jgi:hypothetical protein